MYYLVKIFVKNIFEKKKISKEIQKFFQGYNSSKQTVISF